MEEEMEEKTIKSVAKWVLLVVVIIFGLVTFFAAFKQIDAGHRGVVLKFGAVEDRILGEGLATIMPFVESVKELEVRTQKYEVSASAATKDLLDVQTTVAVNYHLVPSSVNKLYQELGMEYRDRLIAPAVQEVVKATTAKFDAEKLITERALVKLQIEEALKERLFSRDIQIELISITEFSFPTQFNQAITDKQTAIQLKLKAENDLERIEVEAKQAVARAEGEAKSIRIVNEELLRSQAYISFLAVQRWDGKLPLATGGAVPFIEIGGDIGRVKEKK